MTHPVVYAITAGVAIGCIFYYFVTSSFREEERPHGPRSRPPKPSPSSNQRGDWSNFHADIDV